MVDSGESSLASEPTPWSSMSVIIRCSNCTFQKAEPCDFLIKITVWGKNDFSGVWFCDGRMRFSAVEVFHQKMVLVETPLFQ